MTKLSRGLRVWKEIANSLCHERSAKRIKGARKIRDGGKFVRSQASRDDLRFDGLSLDSGWSLAVPPGRNKAPNCFQPRTCAIVEVICGQWEHNRVQRSEQATEEALYPRYLLALGAVLHGVRRKSCPDRAADWFPVEQISRNYRVRKSTGCRLVSISRN